jgi:hypothetical protein
MQPDRRIASIAIACFGIVVIAAVALAAAPCAEDTQKFCADISPGDGRMLECLRKHQAELSETCRNQQKIMQREVRALTACRPDLSRLCSDVTPGGGRIWKCLQAHEGQLSSGCKARFLERGE